MTSDFRRLNAMTETDLSLMEDMKTTLDWFSSRKLYSTLYLKDRFFQVPQKEYSRPLTAIRTVCGLLQYIRFPQVLKNSPATFHRIVNDILGDLKGQCVWIYMHDTGVGSESAEKHLIELEQVLSVAWELQKQQFWHMWLTIIG